MKTIKFKNIFWNASCNDVYELPESTKLEMTNEQFSKINFNSSDLIDILSNEYGFQVKSLEYEIVD